MATKCITITVEAYERLRALKDDRDSFSDVITRITKPVAKSSLFDLVGILSPKDADELEKNIMKNRKRMRARLEQTAAQLP